MFYVVLGIFIAYMYCIIPRVINRPDYAGFKQSNFAHRGFHNKSQKRPENSMKSFQMAVELGYGIEMDVQLTKDKQVVVFHDFDLKRVCGVDKKVCELTFRELSELRLLNTEERIPLLSEVLKMVNGKVPLLVELKCQNAKDQIAPMADKVLSEYQGDYYIESFHPIALRWYKKNRPDIIRGQLAECYGPQKRMSQNIIFFLQQHLIFNVVCRPDFISYNWKHQHELSLNICKYVFGSPLSAWTLRSKEELEKSKSRFDVIIFEHMLL